MSEHQRTQRRPRLQAYSAEKGCEAPHGARRAQPLRWCQPNRKPPVEVFLLFWDEMDDWFGAARHVLRTLT